MNVLFIAGVAVVTPDPPQSQKLYVEALGLPLEGSDGDAYVHSEKHRRRQALRRLAAVAGRTRLLRGRRVAR